MKYLFSRKKLFILLVFLLIILIILIKYFLWIGQGIMSEAKSIGGFHKQEVISFYKKNGKCPNKETDSESKFVKSVYLEQGKAKNICLIRIEIRKEISLVGGKFLFLSTQINENSYEQEWQCTTNTLNWYLPSNCE